MADIVTREQKEIDRGGRPCKYESHVEPRLKEIYEWVKAGYTDYSIADNLGIAKCSLIKYKEQFTELSDLYTRARKERNNLVMNSMYEKAVGIKETVKRAFKVKEVIYDDKGKKMSEKERLEYGDDMIYVPPDVNAADLFLRNNDPDYKSAKSSNDIGNLTINNYQLPQLERELQQIEEQRKTLEMQLGSDYRVIYDDAD